MEITADIKKIINKSVLCWLATVSPENIPNVSPKEIFCLNDEHYLLIANIASPNSIKNIKSNPNICVSILDILVQKGYKLTGTAEIISHKDTSFEKLKKPLYDMAGDRFPFKSIIKIKPNSAKEILAPSYLLYPKETKEEDQIANAKLAYNL